MKFVAALDREDGMWIAECPSPSKSVRSKSQSDGLPPHTQRRETVRIFEADSWLMARQRGSHMILIKDGSMATLSIPDYREVAKGTLRGLIRSCGLTRWNLTTDFSDFSD